MRAQATVSLSLQPTAMTLELGDEFELVAVIESGTTPVDGVQVTLGFNPDYVNVLEIVPSDDLGDLLPAPENLPDRFSNETGRVSYAAGQLFGDAPSGSIEVFRLRLQAVGVTTDTSINFVEDADLFANKVTTQGTTLGLNLLGSSLAIEGPTPTPTATTLTETPTPTETEAPTDTPEPPATDDPDAYPVATEEAFATPTPTYTPTETETLTPTPTTVAEQPADTPRPTDTPLPRRDESPTPLSTDTPLPQATTAPTVAEAQSTAMPLASPPPAEATQPAPTQAGETPQVTPEEAATPASAEPGTDSAVLTESGPATTPEEPGSLAAFAKQNIGSLVAILVIAIAALGFALVRRQMSAD